MDSKELWVGFFVLGVLLFNWPFLKIFGDILPVYLFVGWGLYIAALGVFSVLSRKKIRGG